MRKPDRLDNMHLLPLILSPSIFLARRLFWKGFSWVLRGMGLERAKSSPENEPNLSRGSPCGALVGGWAGFKAGGVGVSQEGCKVMMNSDPY